MTTHLPLLHFVIDLDHDLIISICLWFHLLHEVIHLWEHIRLRASPHTWILSSLFLGNFCGLPDLAAFHFLDADVQPFDLLDQQQSGREFQCNRTNDKQTNIKRGNHQLNILWVSGTGLWWSQFLSFPPSVHLSVALIYLPAQHSSQSNSEITRNIHMLEFKWEVGLSIHGDQAQRLPWFHPLRLTIVCSCFRFGHWWGQLRPVWPSLSLSEHPAVADNPDCPLSIVHSGVKVHEIHCRGTNYRRKECFSAAPGKTYLLPKISQLLLSILIPRHVLKQWKDSIETQVNGKRMWIPSPKKPGGDYSSYPFTKFSLLSPFLFFFLDFQLQLIVLLFTSVQLIT